MAYFGNSYKSSNRFHGGIGNPNSGGKYYSQYHKNYQDLYERLTNPENRGASADVRGYLDRGASGGVPQNVMDYYGRATSGYTPRSVDPEAAINAAILPIESRRNEQFSAVNARLGKLGGMGGTPHALGLGRVAQQSAQDIAAMTQANLLDAAKFNTGMELDAERMRRDAEMGAAGRLLDAAESGYDRQLRAGQILGGFEMAGDDRLAGLAAKLADLGYGGEQGQLDRDWRTGERLGQQDWQTRERLGQQDWQSGESRKSWMRDMGYDPDHPGFDPWDPWGSWTGRRGFPWGAWGGSGMRGGPSRISGRRDNPWGRGY